MFHGKELDWWMVGLEPFLLESNEYWHVYDPYQNEDLYMNYGQSFVDKQTLIRLDILCPFSIDMEGLPNEMLVKDESGIMYPTLQLFIDIKLNSFTRQMGREKDLVDVIMLIWKYRLSKDFAQKLERQSLFLELLDYIATNKEEKLVDCDELKKKFGPLVRHNGIVERDQVNTLLLFCAQSCDLKLAQILLYDRKNHIPKSILKFGMNDAKRFGKKPFFELIKQYLNQVRGEEEKEEFEEERQYDWENERERYDWENKEEVIN